MSAFSSTAGSEYTTGFPITPAVVHDRFRALYVGGAGDVVIIPEHNASAGISINFTAPTFELGHTPVTIKNVAAGTLLGLRGFLVLNGTTATNLVGLA